MAGVNNDIAKYLKGELSPAEMHALEQKALQDPFLAEALEGAEHAGAENFSLDIEVLQRSIRTKTKRRTRKTITLNGWGLYSGIAAGLALLAISTYVIFLSINNHKTEESALPTTLDEETASQPAEEKQHVPLATDADSISSQTLATETTPAEQLPKASTRSQRSGDRAPASGVEETPPASLQLFDATEEDTQLPVAVIPPQEPINTTADTVLAAQEIAEGDDIAETQDEKKGYLSMSEHETERDISTRNKQTRIAKRNLEPSSGVNQHDAGDISKSLEARFIKGKVVSSDNGAGIPGVNVVIKGTNQGTVTDESGNYQIEIQPEQSLMFDFIGYKPEEVAVENDSKEVNVRLNEDVQALSEVVVTGSGTITAERPDVFEMAEPAGGRKAFKKYLEENLQYPSEALERKIEGKVTIQFSVEPDGTVTDFRILKGLGFGCDEELIRLIKEGPKWKPSKKNNQPVKEDVKVRLKFDLPE
jgi:TonB family protein